MIKLMNSLNIKRCRKSSER